MEKKGGMFAIFDDGTRRDFEIRKIPDLKRLDPNEIDPKLVGGRMVKSDGQQIVWGIRKGAKKK